MSQLEAIEPPAARETISAADSPSPTSRVMLADAIWYLLIVAVCLFPALWPADVPWVNDEPALINNALDANAARRLAPTGLWGSFGVAYGPLPTQIYQAALLLTHDPIKLVVGRAVLFMAVTAVGLTWLGRTTRLNRWFVPAVLWSPYFWLFSRLLWDNTFAIPVGVVALAAYAHFLQRRVGWPLVLSIGCCLALVSIHLMTGPLVAAIVGHAIWKHRPALWKHRLGISVVFILFGVSTFGYVRRGVTVSLDYLDRRQVSSPVIPSAANVATPLAVAAPALPPIPTLPDRPDKQPVWKGTIFPLNGGRLLSGERFYFLPEGTTGAGAGAVTLGAHLLVAAGVGIAFARWMRLRRIRAYWSVRCQVGAMLLVILLLQMAMDGVMRVAPYAHYYNGTAIVFVGLAWLAASAISSARLRSVVMAGYGGSLAVFTIVCAVQVHRDGGMRDAFGPSLGQQMQILRDAGNSRIESPIRQLHDHPHALATLRRLMDQPAPDGPAVIVRYASPAGSDARLQIQRTSSEQ